MRNEMTSSRQTPLLAVIVGVASVLGPNTMPLLVAISSRVFGMSAATAGRVTSLEMLGFCAGSVLLTLMLRRASIARLLSISLLVVLAANAATTVGGPELLAPIRFLAGLGEGGGVAGMAAVFSATTAPERFYGAFLCISFLLAMALFRVNLSSIALLGPYAIYWMLATFALLALPAALLTKRPAKEAAKNRAAAVQSASTSLIAVALLGTVVYLTAWTSTWAYAVNICQWSGVSAYGCGVVLGYAAIAAAVGGGLAVVLGHRWGNAIPLMVAGILMAASALLMILKLTPTTYPAAILGWMGGIQFAVPYLVAIMSKADPAGRAASLSIAAQTLGMSVGPALGATVVTGGTAARLAGLSLILLVPSVIAVVEVARALARTSAPAQL